MSDENETPDESQGPRRWRRFRRGGSRPSLGRALLGTGFRIVLYGGIFFLGYNVVSGLFTRGDRAPQAVGPRPAALPDEVQLAPVEAVPGGTARALELALAKTRQQEFVGLGQDVLRTLDDWVGQKAAFEKLTTSLAGGGDGRAIAGDEALLSAYRAVVDLERPGAERAARIRSAAETLVGPIERAHRDPGNVFVPGEDVLTKLGKLLAEAREGRDAYRAARGQVEAISSRAKAKGPAGAVDLRDAVRARTEAEGVASSRALEVERQKGRELVLDAQRGAVSKLAGAKAESARLEGEKQLALEEARRLAGLASLDHERLGVLANSQAIRANFRPFLDQGKYTFEDFIEPRFSDRPAPASFSVLLKAGHLKDVKTFATAMAGYHTAVYGSGPSYTHKNDRAAVKYPATEPEWQRMEELYKQFKELGPFWVEMGLLLP